jgi:hypothetical protein
MMVVFHSNGKRLPWLLGAAAMLLAGGIGLALS